MKEKMYNSRIFYPFSTEDGSYWVRITYEEGEKVLPLISEETEMNYKMIYRKCKHRMITKKELDEAFEEMKLDAYQNRLEYSLESRIFNDGESVYYNLDDGNGNVIAIENGEVEIAKLDSVIFKTDSTSKQQNTPTLDVDPFVLPDLVRKHFPLRSEKDVILLSLYLVSAFVGKEIAHPVLLLNGSPGSGKSWTAKILQEIIDPQKTELLSAPQNRDDMAIRMNASYLVVWDNMRRLKKDFSDLLAQGVSGGVYTKRQLYSNTDEVKIQLRNLIILTGVDVVATEPDALDRSLIINLSRMENDKIVPENILKKQFQKDKSKFLGACFQLLAIALNDKNKVSVPKTRLSESFILMIKIGRALGYEDEEVANIIWENRSRANQISLEDNEVAQCIILLMEEMDEYFDSVGNLLLDLQEIAEENAIYRASLPMQPNVLSRKINQVKMNLEEEYGIKYEIKNSGPNRKIRIWKEKQ